MYNPYFAGLDYDNRYSFQGLNPRALAARSGHPVFGADANGGCMQPNGLNPFGAPAGSCGLDPCQAQAAQALAQLTGMSPFALQRMFPNADPALMRETARGRDLIYGFDSGSAVLIPIGATATLSTAPQKRHIPVRLVVSSTTADNFALSAISVGVEPVLATVGNLSMAIFIEDSTAPDFRAVVCDVGNDVSLIVTNIDTGAAHRFIATMVGTELPR